MMSNNVLANKNTTFNPDRLSSNEGKIKSTYSSPTKRAIDISLLTGGGILNKVDDGVGEGSYTGS